MCLRVVREGTWEVKARPGLGRGAQRVPGEGRQQYDKLRRGSELRGVSQGPTGERRHLRTAIGRVSGWHKEMVTSVLLAVPGPRVRGGAVTGI